MIIGSLPPAAPSSDCLFPTTCKTKQDAAEQAHDIFTQYAAAEHVAIPDAAQPDPASGTAARTGLAKVAVYTANTVKELTFTPPVSYAVKTTLEEGKSIPRELAHLVFSPLTYLGMKVGDKITREIVNRNT